MATDSIRKEVLHGLVIVEYLNKAFGEGFAILKGNGNTEPHKIIIDSECEMLRALTAAYNAQSIINWIKR